MEDDLHVLGPIRRLQELARAVRRAVVDYDELAGR
jgi:hypothetical protein